MPLRDHFRPPVDDFTSWEGLHAQWPAVLVKHVRKSLPPGYTCEPRAHLGARIEVDLAAFEHDSAKARRDRPTEGGAVTAVWPQSAPSVVFETDLTDPDEFGLRFYNVQRGRTLVAAVEIVSPSNKDRPEHRNTFVAKCVSMLRSGIAVSVIDLVTVRRFNLYAELLAFLGHKDPTLPTPAPPTYAASARLTKGIDRGKFESWSNELAVGKPLPAIPIWLNDDVVITLELEAPYEEACDDLFIV